MQVKAVRYWPSPDDPDEILEREFEAYDAKIYVKFISQKNETDYIIRELEIWKINNKDGKVRINKGMKLMIFKKHWIFFKDTSLK